MNFFLIALLVGLQLGSPGFPGQRPLSGRGGPKGASAPPWLEADQLLEEAFTSLRDRTPGSFNRARELATKAQAIYRRHGVKRLELQALNTIARSYSVEGRHLESKRIGEMMMQTAREANEPHVLAIASLTLGTSAMHLGQLEEAFLFAQQAYDTIPGPHAGAALLLGRIHNRLAQPRSALVYLKEVLDIGLPDPLLQAQLNTEIGVAAFQMRDYQKATEYLGRALDAGVNNPAANEISTLHMLAGCYLELNKLEIAERYARRAMDLALKLNNDLLISVSYVRLGAIALSNGNDRAAEAYFRQADLPLAIGTDHGFLGLGLVYERRKELEQALQFYEHSIELHETRRRARAAEEDRLSVFRQINEPYQRSVNVLLKLHFRDNASHQYAEQAFRASERIRNRLSVDQMLESWNRTSASPTALDEQLNAVERTMNEISGKLLNGSPSTADQVTLQVQFERLEIQKSAIRRNMAYYSKLTRTSSNSEENSIEQVQRILPDGVAFLEYSIGDPAAVFVVTKDRFTVVRLPGLNDLDSRVDTYLRLLNSSASEFGSFAKSGGFHLYQDVLAPVIRILPENISQLVISPAGALELLPFEALTIDPNGRFLIEGYAVSYAPSASTLEILHERDGVSSAHKLLAFADPVYSSNSNTSSLRGFFEDDKFALSPLPRTRAEVESLAQIAGFEDFEMILGNEASEGKLKSLQLSDYRVLHFATHAVANQSYPERSALVLTAGREQNDDGFLQVREVYDLRLNADLVVLSACQTTGGTTTAGEGVPGLSRAFFFAGARSLVASIWKVEDKATTQLMTAFYRNLAAGLTKTESLRKAKIEMIRTDGSHPRQWAAFVVFGDGGILSAQSAVTKTTSYALPISLLVASILLLGSLLRWSYTGRKRIE
jgi:CHAT domain-containing protein